MYTTYRHLTVLVAALTLLAGCETPEVCTALGACGGDVSAGGSDLDADGTPDARWLISGACLNEVFLAAQNASLINQPPPVQGQPPPEPTHANWCSDMVLGADKKISKINPWFPAIPIRDGSVTYFGNGSFNVQINYFAYLEVSFPSSCFDSQGFTLLPAGSATGSNTMTCAEFNGVLAERLSTEPNIAGVACGDDGQNGCTCVYDLLMVTGANGTWSVNGTTVNHFDKITGEPVSRADYCVDGNTLDLYGHDRAFLFNQPHLRSLTLVKE